MPKILVMAGGTGGHIYPGIAVAQQLQQQGWQVLWLGTRERMEADIVPQHGFDIAFLSVSGVRGKGLLSLLAAPLMIIRAIVQALQLLRQFKPNMVLGMGGYASGPGGLAAKLLGIPLLIHEQNAIAGKTNQLLAKIANRIATGFDKVLAGPKTDWTGNPIRRDIEGRLPSCSEPLSILVVGGSLGAQSLNQHVPHAVAQLAKQTAVPLRIIHQVGKGNISDVQASYDEASAKVEVVEFIDDIATVYEQCDLVICRAGALTVSEIAVAKRAAIFIPLPHAVDDHQTQNARVLVDVGAAKLLPQLQLQQGQLISLLAELIEQPEILSEMAQACEKVALPDATDRVCHLCHQLVEEQ